MTNLWPVGGGGLQATMIDQTLEERWSISWGPVPSRSSSNATFTGVTAQPPGQRLLAVAGKDDKGRKKRFHGRAGCSTMHWGSSTDGSQRTTKAESVGVCPLLSRILTPVTDSTS